MEAKIGLDMYLTVKQFLWTDDYSKPRTVTIQNTRNQPLPFDAQQIEYKAGSWRKANAIHAWFVQNVQNGVDDCKEYLVRYEQLQELKALCTKVLDTPELATSLLPPQSGFFFGSTEVDDYYFDDLKLTISIIDKIDATILKFYDDNPYYCEDVFYSSSW